MFVQCQCRTNLVKSKNVINKSFFICFSDDHFFKIWKTKTIMKMFLVVWCWCHWIFPSFLINGLIGNMDSLISLIKERLASLCANHMPRILILLCTKSEGSMIVNQCSRKEERKKMLLPDYFGPTSAFYYGNRSQQKFHQTAAAGKQHKLLS